MTAAILSIGTELLLGRTRDTNFPFLAARLTDLGARVVTHATVPDHLPHMIAALRDAAARADVVITVGGLGPTVDDRTREAIVAVTGCALARDEATLDAIRARFAARGAPMAPLNEVQALLPRGAEALSNANGTAPGIWLEHEGRIYVALPGPPRELHALAETHVLPRLAARLGERRREHLTLRTVGVPESTLADRLSPHLPLLERYDVAFLPHGGQVDVRVTFAGVDRARDARDRAAIVAAVREAAGAAFMGEGETALEERIGADLRQRKTSIGVAESCTAGLVAARLISVPSASDYVRGGIVAYSNDAKVELLGVPSRTIDEKGAVSPEVAVEMARGARRRFAAEIGVGTTGIAGPAGERPGKPIGLVYLAVATDGGAAVERYVFPGDRADVTARATLAALDLLRRVLEGTAPLSADALPGT